MAVLLINRGQMFVLFEQDGRTLFTVTTGGVAQVNVTIWVTSDEAAGLVADPDKASRLASQIAANTKAFAEREVQPSVLP